MEKEKSVKDLITNIEKKIEKTNKVGLEKESQKIEEIYKRKREEKLKYLLEKLSEEEKIRVSQLIEKHSQEMLFLIAEKLCLSEVIVLQTYMYNIMSRFSQNSLILKGHYFILIQKLN